MQQINIDRYAIYGRGEGALLAWKLDDRGTVVDEVVDQGGSTGSGRNVYRQKEGGETINTQQ